MNSTSHNNRGFALVFMVIILAIIISLGFIVMEQVDQNTKLSSRYGSWINTLQLAEAGIQKAIFCLNNDDASAECNGTAGEAYPGEENIALDPGSFSVDVADLGLEDLREILATGTDASGSMSEILVSARKTYASNDDTEFNFSVLTGSSFEIKNHAVIDYGPVFLNHDFECTNDPTINADIYVTLPGGTLTGCIITGNVYADNIINSTVTGDCHYNGSLSGTTCSGTTYSGATTPVPAEFPVFDEAFWQAEALAGGTYSGDYDAPDNSTLGPIKIEGDLTIDADVDVTMTGAIWVTGELNIANHASLKVDSSFENRGSVIIIDGIGSIENGADIDGTGHPDSHLVLYSTVVDDLALSINNKGGTAIYYAPYGTVQIVNDGEGAAVAADKVILSGHGSIGAAMTTAVGAISLDLNGAPDSWWEVNPQTWRQLK